MSGKRKAKCFTQVRNGGDFMLFGRRARIHLALGVLAICCGNFNALGQQPITFQYIYDSRSQLARVLDSVGNVVTYTYDEVGNILAVTRNTVGNLSPPVVTTVTPNRLNQGESATLNITGTSLLGGRVTTTYPGI